MHVLTKLWLAATSSAPHPPATAASGPALPAASQPATAMTTEDQVFLSFMFAWLVLAILALFKSNVFSPRPLRIAPPRSAAMLLPLAGGVLVVYILVGAIAMQVGMQTGLFSRSALGLPDNGALTVPPPPVPASHPTPSSNPATAPAAEDVKAAGGEAEGSAVGKAPRASPEEMMWVQVVSIVAELFATGMALLVCHLMFVNGLRILSGTFSLGSQRSMCEGPPCR